MLFVVAVTPFVEDGTISGCSSKLTRAFFFFVLLSTDLTDRVSELSLTCLALSGELVRIEGALRADLAGDVAREGG